MKALVYSYGYSGTLLILGGCMLHISISAALYRPLAVHVQVTKSQHRNVIQLTEASHEDILEQQNFINKEIPECQHHMRKLHNSHHHQYHHNHHMAHEHNPDEVVARLQVSSYAKKSSKIGPKIIFNKKLFNLVQTLTFFG